MTRAKTRSARPDRLMQRSIGIEGIVMEVRRASTRRKLSKTGPEASHSTRRRPPAKAEERASEWAVAMEQAPAAASVGRRTPPRPVDRLCTQGQVLSVDRPRRAAAAFEAALSRFGVLGSARSNGWLAHQRLAVADAGRDDCCLLLLDAGFKLGFHTPQYTVHPIAHRLLYSQEGRDGASS